jgi:transposase
MRKQKSPAEFGFNRFDKMRLGKAMKEVADKCTFLRLKAVFLCAEGMSVPSVAKLFDKSFQIVYYWVDAYLKQHSTQALFDASRSGRPLSAQRIKDARILKELKRKSIKIRLPNHGLDSGAIIRAFK